MSWLTLAVWLDELHWPQEQKSLWVTTKLSSGLALLPAAGWQPPAALETTWGDGVRKHILLHKITTLGPVAIGSLRDILRRC